MNIRTLKREVTWAEDRATVRTDPSADPGAEVEGGAVSLNRVPPTFPFDLGIKAINLRSRMLRFFRHDVVLHALISNRSDSGSR